MSSSNWFDMNKIYYCLVTCGLFSIHTKVVSEGTEEEKAHITHLVEEDVHRFGLRGIRSLAVAKTNDEGRWEFLGLLTFLDPPRPDTKKTIEDANAYGVAVKMITGDHLLIAKETARFETTSMIAKALLISLMVNAEFLAWETILSPLQAYPCWTRPPRRSPKDFLGTMETCAWPRTVSRRCIQSTNI